MLLLIDILPILINSALFQFSCKPLKGSSAKFRQMFSPGPLYKVNKIKDLAFLIIGYICITCVLEICEVKRAQSKAMEQKCLDLRSLTLSHAPSNLWLLLVYTSISYFFWVSFGPVQALGPLHYSAQTRLTWLERLCHRHALNEKAWGNAVQ